MVEHFLTTMLWLSQMVYPDNLALSTQEVFDPRVGKFVTVLFPHPAGDV
jgi:hypothetical protein